jgi:hypothetical protein
MVDREKFGERHGCFACGCKFYDMNRNPPTCPRCGADVSKPPKIQDEVPFTPVDIEEEDEEIPEDIDEKSLEVDTDDEVGADEDVDD